MNVILCTVLVAVCICASAFSQDVDHEVFKLLYLFIDNKYIYIYIYIYITNFHIYRGCKNLKKTKTNKYLRRFDSFLLWFLGIWELEKIRKLLDGMKGLHQIKNNNNNIHI